MKCPFCGFENDKVVDSRESKEGESIRRRRECLQCEKRFTTYERPDVTFPAVVVNGNVFWGDDRLEEAAASAARL